MLLSVKCFPIVRTDLHATDVGLEAALLIADGSDGDVELIDAHAGLIQLALGVLAGALGLRNGITV